MPGLQEAGESRDRVKTVPSSVPIARKERIGPVGYRRSPKRAFRRGAFTTAAPEAGTAAAAPPASPP